MEMDMTKKCPVVEVNGFIEKGKQFDLDIQLPEDERNVIYGVIKDECNDPVEDAVVKLIEVCCEKGEEVRKPVSHTFTDEYGEFVFGPLCPDRKYAIDVWVNKVRHVKICAKCHHKSKCLKGIDIDFCDTEKPCYPYDKKPCCPCDKEPSYPCDKKPCCPCDKRECLSCANQCENK